MSRAQRIARRVDRRVHESTRPFLRKPKHVPAPKRIARYLLLSPADYSLLQSIGEGSAADGISILCDAFRGGLRYIQDGRRKHTKEGR